MFKNTFQSGFLSILYSLGSKPLQIWDKEVVNGHGHVKRPHDEDIQSNVLEIIGSNIQSTYITCPSDPSATLGIKLPFLVMIVKNLKKYFTFEIQILDDKNVRRRFRSSNFQAVTRVKPYICTMPLRLDDGWNQIQLNLADYTRKAYGTNYVETLRVQVHANCRLRRIYFSDRLYSEEELPPEFKLYLPIQVLLKIDSTVTDSLNKYTKQQISGLIGKQGCRDAKQDGDDRVRNWVADIREVAYDTEDAIDSYILRMMRPKETGPMIRIKKKIHDISCCSRSTYGIENIGRGGEGTSLTVDSLREKRRSYPHSSVEEIVVGTEKDINILEDQLINGELRLSVISIIGMAGLEDKSVEFLRDLCKKVMGLRKVDTEKMHKEEMEEELSSFLKKKRIFWKLLSKKICLEWNATASLPAWTEDLGKEILKKCGGLLLAIVILGGLLSRREATFKERLKVLQSAHWQLLQDPAQCMDILALSYHDLPYYLKPCFLYPGLFPEDFEISAQRPTLLWVAEGFVHPRGQEPLEDVAEDYLVELVGRSMVQVAAKKLNGMIKTIRIHDLLRELAIRKGKEDPFFDTIHGDVKDCFLTRPRRLSTTFGITPKSRNASRIRSLLFFDHNEPKLKDLKETQTLASAWFGRRSRWST
ncbi:hypothetical protein PTKIN_Ptkin05aG0189300 [Pterospermum kingtungense]